MSKKNTFEDQLATLEQIVESLEKGNIPLEDAMKQFEQGIKLARLCQKNLSDAQTKMEKLLNSHDITPPSLDKPHDEPF
ncbi:MAG: exodeoxyribonuclease VII small subunit [Gammaproteobacteria bacterium]|nr:exodeoxyribonuclease VII small subunit [Gammaproteobacteria bacterium]